MLKRYVLQLENIGMDKLVLDLRNNGGGLLDQAVKMVDLFINSRDTILYTKGKLKGKHTGGVGFLGCLSFNINKIITRITHITDQITIQIFLIWIILIWAIIF